MDWIKDIPPQYFSMLVAGAVVAALWFLKKYFKDIGDVIKKLEKNFASITEGMNALILNDSKKLAELKAEITCEINQHKIENEKQRGESNAEIRVIKENWESGSKLFDLQERQIKEHDRLLMGHGQRIESIENKLNLNNAKG